ncbi:MAG: peptidase M48 [Ignavibacteriae bacterium]|nr:peptidase M48 [Ignavibacteriota bacterium]
MKMIIIKKKIIYALAAALIVVSCSTGINLFTDNDEVHLGSQFDQEIKNNPKEYPIYKNSAVKNYIDTRIFQHLLQSPEIKKKTVYNYQLEMIDNDSVLNAFAVPGGYVYLYTGLVKYLETEAALAGVLGHEIAHVERRHATQRITSAYGLQMIASLALGNNPSEVSIMVANLFSGLALLANSRSDEDESDEYSIKYLAETRYYPGAVKFFFEKLKDDGKVSSASGGIQTFLSTHPDPVERISTTNTRISNMGYPVKDYKASGEGIFREEYKTNILSKMK